jgi:uroporphyrin-3 C-methyltransferase
MVNSSIDSNNLPAETDSIVASSKLKQTDTVKKSRWVFFVFLLALIALGLSGYNLYLTRKLQQTNASDLFQRFNEVQQTLGQFNDKASQTDSEILQLNQRVDKLNQVKQNNTWQMQEIDYLLHLANFNLKYQHDPATTISLLSLADERLAKLNNPQLNQLRQLLARDIASIKVIEAIDVTGILARLQALTEKIKTLPTLTAEPSTQTIAIGQNSGSLTGAWWQRALQQGLNALQHLVTIHHYDETTRPLITKEQQYLLTTLIEIYLSQAQWAALHYEQNLWQNNLQQALELTEMTFGTSPQKTAFLAELGQLKKLNLAIPMPDLSNTIANVPQAHIKPSESEQALSQPKAQPAKPIKPTQQESALV